MQFEINGKQYWIEFRHEQRRLWKMGMDTTGLVHDGCYVITRSMAEIICDHVKRTHFNVSAMTTVQILTEDKSADDKSVFSTGYGFCFADDTFNKETGRKVALRRALDDTSFSHDERRIVWAAYFNRGNVAPKMLSETAADAKTSA